MSAKSAVSKRGSDSMGQVRAALERVLLHRPGTVGRRPCRSRAGARAAAGSSPGCCRRRADPSSGRRRSRTASRAAARPCRRRRRRCSADLPGVDVVGPEADLVEVPACRSGPRARRRRAASDGWSRKWTTLPPIRIGRSQWLLDESRKTFSSAGEYQSAGAGVAGSSGSSAPRHVLPEELLERPDPGRIDRVHRVDGHSELSGEEPEAVGVVGAADDTVVVEVEPGRDPGVRLGREAVRVDDRRGAVLPDREVVVLEEAERRCPPRRSRTR